MKYYKQVYYSGIDYINDTPQEVNEFYLCGLLVGNWWILHNKKEKIPRFIKQNKCFKITSKQPIRLSTYKRFLRSLH